MADAYWNHKDEDGFAAVVKIKDILKKNNGNLSIQLYVMAESTDSAHSVQDLLTTIHKNRNLLEDGYNKLNSKLNELGIEMS